MMTMLKDWGRSVTVFKTAYVEVILLYINKNHESSIHHHQHKNSIFRVISGTVEFYCGDPRRPTSINPQKLNDHAETINVPKGIPHGFRALDDSVVLEIYYMDGIDPHDIITDGTISDHNKQKSSCYSAQ